MEEIQATPWLRVTDELQRRLPVFVYMDDYRIFSGAAQLDDVLARKQRKQAKSEDETIMLIMEMAGLNLDDLLPEKLVLHVGQILGVAGNCALEDLFDEGYYVAQTQSAYAKELTTKKLTLAAKPSLSVVERMEESLKKAGIPEFNKGRVAKRIMEDLAKKKLSDLPATTAENFKKVIATANELVAGWRKA